jgi:heptosyltransferase-2
MTRSLVVAPQWIGDAVMSEPLMARLAARGEGLSVAALPWVAPVYRAMPPVREVIELPFAHGRLDWAERRRIGKTLRGRFDAAYVCPNSIKSALLPWFARIPRRVGYRGEGRFWLLNERLPNPPGRPPMVAFYSALAGPLPQAAERPKLRFADATLDAAARTAGVERGAYFAFAPGAEYGPAKCWPASHYAGLARSLQAAHGLPVLLLGSAKEAALCESIARMAPGACRVMAGQTSLQDAMALIGAARGVVTNDSGLMHVAAALNRPLVAVYGSTSPQFTPPLADAVEIVRLGLECSPCFDRVCRFGHYNCLRELPPSMVLQALDRLVADPVDVE